MTPETSASTQQTVATPGGAARVLEFKGRLTFSEQSEQHFAELRRYIEEGARTFVFDLRQVPDVDSAGLGFLVTCLTTAQRAGAELRLAAPSNRVLYALLITKLDAIFPVFETVEAALQWDMAPALSGTKTG